MLTESTEEAKEKFQAQLEEIHTAFANHIEDYRGQLLNTTNDGVPYSALCTEIFEPNSVRKCHISPYTELCYKHRYDMCA